MKSPVTVGLALVLAMAGGVNLYMLQSQTSEIQTAGAPAALWQGWRQQHWTFGSTMPVEQPLADVKTVALTRHVRELPRENGIV